MTAPSGAPGEGVVAVCEVTSSVRSAVRRAMELADWEAYVPEGSRIALKPNLCWDLPLPGAQTSPWVLDVVIEVLKERAAEIVVVEAGQVTVDVDVALERSGLGRIVRKHRLEFVNMSRGEFVDVRLDGAYVLHEARLPSVLAGRVLVSVPVLKTHGLTRLSGALKNQWGCLPEMRHRYHPVVHEAIADLNDLLRPAFAVMDATVALEGSGPKTGTPRVVDLVLASPDLVAMDATAARVIGLDPARVEHVVHAEARGLGVSTGLTLRGDPVRIVAGFRPAQPNLVARAETAARRSAVAGIAFDTPVFAGLAAAARAWNAAWWIAAGARRRRAVIGRTRYGAQWRGLDEHETTPGSD